MNSQINPDQLDYNRIDRYRYLDIDRVLIYDKGTDSDSDNTTNTTDTKTDIEQY